MGKVKEKILKKPLLLMLRNRIIRDWYVPDFIAFEKPVRESTGFSPEFVAEWNALKLALFTEFYKKYRDALKDATDITSPMIEASIIAKLAKAEALRICKERKSEIAKKLEEHNVSEDKRESVMRALLVREAICHCIGGSSDYANKLAQLVYALCKQQ